MQPSFSYERAAALVLYLVLLVLSAGVLSGEALAAEEIRGRVENRDGASIEHARVAIAETNDASHGNGAVFTDNRGRFVVECPLPCTLLLSHPRFVDQAVTVAEPTDAELEIALQGKQEVFEEILVTASRGSGDALAPESITSTIVRTDEKMGQPTSLLEVVEDVPGVSENGQGGLFQVFSIRGVSRLRVMSLIDGMQIVGERRAGVSTSFVDPTLMDGVEVLRGPASTFYGSGALGGVVQVFPRTFEKPRISLGYDGFAEENYQSIGWGTGEWSFGFARRERSDDEAADGSPLNEHFEQFSATLARRWQTGDKTYEILAIPTLGRDIGKSSSEFPDSRIVNYPQETHLLLRFGMTSEKGWRFYAYAHPNNLRTESLRPGRSFNVVRNQSFDVGANFQREVKISGKLTGRFGFDWFGRRGVEARETEDDFRQGMTFDSLTLDAERDDLAAYGSLRFNLGSAVLQAGMRFTLHEERQAGISGRDDTAVTGFLGLVKPLGGGFELTANAGTGLRFPSLSERFFSGTTGRGSVIGNPDLEPEESLNLDLGLAWYGTRAFVSAQVFRQEIDDYIERIDVTDDLRTFVNLTAGEIVGVELEGFVQLAEPWRLHFSGHAIDGEEDDSDRTLSDIPPDRAQIGLRYAKDRWMGRLTLQHRWEKVDFGSGERPIPEVDLLSFGVEYELQPGLKLTLRGRNLLDETYLNSADEDGPVAPGRSIGVGILWEP